MEAHLTGKCEYTVDYDPRQRSHTSAAIFFFFFTFTGVFVAIWLGEMTSSLSFCHLQVCI